MSTDVSDIAETVSGLHIEGPGAPTHADATTLSETPDPDDLDGVTMTIIRPDGTESEPIPASILTDPTPAKDALFATDKWLTVPTIEGNSTDELVITFSGSVKYDAADPQGQQMFRDLRLGKDVDLRVSGFVGGKAGSYKMAGVGTDNEREVVAGKVTVKVTDLFLLAPEDL